MNTETFKEYWNAYMLAYGAVDENECKRLLEQSIADDVVFTNPASDGKSRLSLMAHIAKFQKANPGAYFTTDKLYAQPDKLLAVWSMYKKDGTKITTGYNFVRPDSDGRFNYLQDFFDIRRFEAIAPIMKKYPK